MLADKERAVDKYIETKGEYAVIIGGGFKRQPELLRNENYKAGGVEVSITLYKLMMYRLGIVPTNIVSAVEGLKKTATRKADVATKTAIAAADTLLTITGNNRFEDRLAPKPKVITLRPGIEEIIKKKPALNL